MVIDIKSSIKNYSIVIKNNSLSELSSIFNLGNQKVLIVTDDNIPESYIEKVKSNFKENYLLVFPHGEETKSIDSYLKIQETLIVNEFTRHDLVIALGGGVIGDLVAFAASTFKRGIEFINIPTSSLSMIDSSIGGKTAINYKHFKNMIGTFYPPKGVLIDFSLLESLPKRQLNNGLMEALKCGYIRDTKILELLKEETLNIPEIITRSLLVKQYFVENDEKEESIRKILNYGHTLGHAFESKFGFSDVLYHGEAVGIGMLIASNNKEETLSLLKKLELHFDQEVNVDEILEFIKNDKKMNHGVVDFIKIHENGNPYIEPTTLDEIKTMLEGGLEYVRYLR